MPGTAGTNPTVTTGATSSLTYNSVTLGGNVTAIGTPNSGSDEKGIVYSLTATNNNPTVGGTGVTTLTTTGTLTTGAYTNATGAVLTPSSGYSYAAYAKNSAGTSYGTVSTFTTPASPTASLAVTGTAGHGTFCVGTAGSPITYTITNSGGSTGTITSVSSSDGQFVVSNLSSTSIAASGGTATFDVTFTPSAGGAQSATLTVNGENSPTYGVSGTGTANAAPPAPTSNTATAIGTTTATLGATATAATCPATLTERGIVWNTTGAPTTADNKVNMGTTTGTYTGSVTGLPSGTLIYYRGYSLNSVGTPSYNATTSTFTTLKLEPSNHVTSLALGSATQNTLTVTWADNNGSVAADKFLVRLSTGTPSDPTDGVAVADATLDKNINAGVGTVTFTGLSSSTSYTVKVYPYSNSGTNIDYKIASAPSATASTSAGPLVDYTMTSTSTPATVGTGVTASALTIKTGSLTYQASPSNVWSTGYAATKSKYIQFTVTPTTGALTVTGITFDAGRSSGTAPGLVDVYFSLNNFTIDSTLGLSGGASTNTSGLSTLALTTLPTTSANPLTVRLYPYGSNTGNFRLNNIEVYGSVTSAPVLAVSQNATSYVTGSTFAFGSVPVGSFLEKDFTLTNNGAATLNITQPNGITTSGAQYSIISGGGTTTIAPASSATVRVRYTPSAFSLEAGTLDIVSDDIAGSTYTVNLTGTGSVSNTSTIDVDPTYTYNNSLNYLTWQSATISNTGTGAGGSADILKFRINDGGGSADPDALPTILNSVSFTIASGSSSVRSAALFNGNALVATGTVGSGLISFSGLSGAAVTAADGGSTSLTLRVTFTTTATDNQSVQVSLNQASVAAAGSNTSSTFGTFSFSSNVLKNLLIVTGDRLAFVTQPGGSVGVASNFTVSVAQVDVNGNRDTDVNTGTVSITKLTGGGNLTGNGSITVASGLAAFNSLQIDALTTGVTLQVSISPALSGTSVLVTNSFDVNGVGYNIGDYRTTASGSTSWSSLSNWEQFDGTSWSAASSVPNNATVVAHIERSMTMGCIGSRYQVNKLYIKGSSTVLTTNSGCSPSSASGIDIQGSDGVLRILSGKMQVDGGVFIQDAAGQLIVDSLATLVVNYGANNQSLIWNGVENFKNGSTIEIQTWDISTSGLIDETATRKVANNAGGYKFGNIIVNNGTASAIFKLLEGNTAANICQGNLTINANNNRNVVGSANNVAYTIGGNVVVNAGQFSVYALTSGSPTATIKGSITLNNASVLDLNQNNSASALINLTLQGGLNAFNTAKIQATDVGSTLTLDGDRRHDLQQGSSSTDPFVGIPITVTSGDTARILGAHWYLSNNSSITVASGAVFDCSTDTFTPWHVLEKASSAATTAFTLASGGTLIVTDPDGITASSALGSIQVDTRSYSTSANYYFKPFYTLSPVSTGDGLPTTLTGNVTYEGKLTIQQLALTNSVVINTPGTLIIKEGNIYEGTTGTFFDGTGNLTMTGGQLLSARTGSSLTFPRFTGTYSLTGGSVILTGTTNSASAIQTLRGGRTYYNVAFSGISSAGGYKTISSGITVTNNVTINSSTEIVDLQSHAMDGTGGLTMTGGLLRISKLTNAQPELTGAYALSGGTVELYGSSATQSHNLRGSSTPGTITYYNVKAGSVASNPTGNVGLSASMAIAGEFRVAAPAYLNLDAADNISGAGTFVLENGAGLRFANQYGIRTAGTTTTSGNLRMAGTRSFGISSTYIAAGAAANAELGNAIPFLADSLIIARTSGNIATSFAVKIGRKLRFAGPSLLTTGTDTVTLGPNASVIGEASDRYVLGLLKSYRTSVGQNSPNTLGNIGVTVNALGGAPGNMSVVRATGTGIHIIGETGNSGIDRIYTIHAANNTALNAQVTFNYFDAELGSVQESKLDAYRSVNGATDWTRFPAAGRNPVGNFVVVNNVPGFSTWTLGGYDTPLPVVLSSFTGKVQGQVAVLNWQTSSEQNSAGFEVQRSANGQEFTKVGYVASKAEARQGADYSFVDRGFTGHAYYRLRQLDRDGKATLSQAILLTNDKALASIATVSPQPATGALTLRWPGQEEAAVSATVFSADGKLLLSTEGSLETLSTQLTNLLATQATGLYQLHLQTPQGSQVIKVVK